MNTNPSDQTPDQLFQEKRKILIKALITYGVPVHCRAGLLRHILYGMPVGGFLTTLLEGAGWINVIKLADQTNQLSLGNYWNFLRNAAPALCWNSTKYVGNWQKSGGLAGQMEITTSFRNEKLTEDRL